MLAECLEKAEETADLLANDLLDGMKAITRQAKERADQMTVGEKALHLLLSDLLTMARKIELTLSQLN